MLYNRSRCVAFLGDVQLNSQNLNKSKCEFDLASLLSHSSLFSFQESHFVGQLSGVCVCVCVWQRPPSAAPPAPSRSWEVTQFPMIQRGCFCCVVAVAILQGPLMPTVSVPWIMDRESDRVLGCVRERGGGGGKDEWREWEVIIRKVEGSWY